jgi:hypothetical protein
MRLDQQNAYQAQKWDGRLEFSNPARPLATDIRALFLIICVVSVNQRTFTPRDTPWSNRQI